MGWCGRETSRKLGRKVNTAVPSATLSNSMQFAKCL